jgi:hypothetical protein
MNNWPDWGYHTNEDRPWSADPTQLKRAVFIALASGYAMAAADGPQAVRVAETAAGQAAERTGTELRHALQMIGDRAPYREARVLVEQAYIREAEAIRSASVLAETDTKSTARIEELAKTFLETGRSADLARLDAYAKSAGVMTNINLSSEEALAATMVPKRKPAPRHSPHSAEAADAEERRRVPTPYFLVPEPTKLACSPTESARF